MFDPLQGLRSAWQRHQRMHRARTVRSDPVSVAYRAGILKISNFIRLLIVALLVMSEMLFHNQISENIPLPYNTLVMYVGAYLSFLLVMLISVRRWANKDGIYLFNALFDLLFLGMLVVISRFSTPLTLIMLVSLTLNIILLTTAQAFIMGLVAGAVVFLAYLGNDAWEYWRNYLNEELAFSEAWQAFWRTVLSSGSRLRDALLMALAVVLLAVLVGHQATRTREAEVRARINRAQIERLTFLNRSIVENFKAGIIVVSNQGEIVIMNKQAKVFFKMDEEWGKEQEKGEGKREKKEQEKPLILSNISIALNDKLHYWQLTGLEDHTPFSVGETEVTAQFDALQGNAADLLLIVLEDITETHKRVQEARLIALGHLSAGIAHEVRNPLAAIQSASDLLAEQIGEESENSAMILKLTGMIHNNIKRANAIISDVLNLFHSDARDAELLVLNSFLQQFVDDFGHTYPNAITITLDLQASENLAVYFDRGHLYQILSNLCLNAIDHASVPDRALSMRITSSCAQLRRAVYLDFWDNGPGVAADKIEKIFDPFYTGHAHGTGLGLYLVKEICTANHAHIFYIKREQGACFRLSTQWYNPEENIQNIHEDAQTA